jgi:hypothetical protein
MEPLLRSVSRIDAVGGFHRRIALGKVFKDAFTHLIEEWKEIILG